MATRKIILFKVNGQVVVEERKELTQAEIERMCWVVAEELDVPIFDVDTEVIDTGQELSSIDVTTDGLIDWRDAYFRRIVGVKMNLKVGSDEYLDAILNNTLEEHLEFDRPY